MDDIERRRDEGVGATNDSGASMPSPPVTAATEPEPPRWLKGAVAGAAVFAIVLVALAVGSSRSGQPSGPTTPLPLSAVAREYCATQTQVVQAVTAAQTAVQSGDPSRTLQQSRLSLAQIQNAIAQLRNESEQSKTAGDGALADALSGMADSLQEVHDGISALDSPSVQDGASKLIPFAETVKADPAISGACV